ncbi:MmgE/PrpD family protein [Paraglaciecola mesophila]|uniref:MmgE/PrpD family protein n=1 Tax=Paraglaciecola mesophila TaxID=197222 RepID=UPI001362952F|nr:MmgE/PrpD family protein [Paraglaciecola mesophila]
MPINLSLTKQLLIDIDQKSVTAQDLTRAGAHVLDWVACASLGVDSAAGSSYQALLTLDAGGVCSAIGQSKPLSMQNAALYNGALGNVLEMDDIHRSSIVHPGPVVIPAALAAAQQVGCSLEVFLHGVIRGYELTIRLGEAIGRSHYAYFHNTATCGALGAAAAVSTIFDLTLQQTLWAIGNAGSTTGGLWQMRNEQVLTKQWHNAEACRSGLMAGFMAKHNLNGPEYILEGPQGIFTALSSDATPESFLRKHPQWRIYDCSFKPWPACRHAHPAMDVLQSLLSEFGFSADEVSRIEVGVYQDAQVFCDRADPQTTLEAKFSIQHDLAAMLLWGTPALEHYLPEAYTQAQCGALRKLIQVNVSEDVERRYPAHFGARCTVTLKNGTRYEREHIDTLGDPENPLTQAQRHAKVHMLLVQSGMPEQQIQQLCDFDWLQSGDISTFSTLMCAQQGE